MGSNKKSDAGADDDEIAVTQNFAFWNNSAAHLASVALSDSQSPRSHDTGRTNSRHAQHGASSPNKVSRTNWVAAQGNPAMLSTLLLPSAASPSGPQATLQAATGPSCISHPLGFPTQTDNEASYVAADDVVCSRQLW